MKVRPKGPSIGAETMVAVGGQGVVDGLNVCGVQPDCGADAGLGDGREIGAGNDIA